MDTLQTAPSEGTSASPSRPGDRPLVVIVGAGFGGLSAAKALASAPVDITLIDRRNYHLFQPLLYQVATAGLSPADIAWPIRRIVRSQANTRVLLGEVIGVDADARVVRMSGEAVPYDYLILATGARHAYFGNDAWEPFAPGLKKIEDATDIRRRILMAFERAEAEPDPGERDRLLTFVIVGAGPTGVELAGAIAELARRVLAKDFRNIDPRQTRILLVEAGLRVLPSFPETLSAFAGRALEKLGVEVLLGEPITACDADGVALDDRRIGARTVLWGAGVAASAAGEWLGVETDRAARVVVQPDLTVPGHPEVFVIGDTAAATDDEGRQLPGIAPVAKQQGRHAADSIRRTLAGDVVRPAFRYSHAGSLATIGRSAAVIDFGWLRLKGWLAWWIWGVAHVYFLIGMRNRLLVAIQWLWSYILFDRGARLITGTKDD